MKAFQKSNNLFMSMNQVDLENIEFPNNDAMNVSPKMAAHLANSGKRYLKQLSRPAGHNAKTTQIRNKPGLAAPEPASATQSQANLNGITSPFFGMTKQPRPIREVAKDKSSNSKLLLLSFRSLHCD